MNKPIITIKEADRTVIDALIKSGILFEDETRLYGNGYFGFCLSG